MSFLNDQILKESKKLGPALRKYKRTTGRMESKNVSYNYLRFCSWLELLKIEGGLVSPTSYTIFFSTLKPETRFDLSEEERLAFFIHLWPRVPELGLMLEELSMSRATTPSAFRSTGITEHHAETFMEWFVDLDLVSPTKAQFGSFYLSPTGNAIRTHRGSHDEACRAFASATLKRGIDLDGNISSDDIWGEIVSITKDILPHITNPVDSKLVAILPVLLRLQIHLLTLRGIFLPMDGIVSRARIAAEDHGASFTWDPSYNTGFLKFG